MIYFLCGFAIATSMWAIIYTWSQRIPDESKLWPNVKTDPTAQHKEQRRTVTPNLRRGDD